MIEKAWPGIVTALLWMTGPGVSSSLAVPISTAELDQSLVRRVAEFLGEEPSLITQVRDLKISAHDGQVTLEGTVASPEIKRSIHLRAEEISGRNLNDQLHP